MKLSATLRKASIVGVSAVFALALAGCSGTNYGYTGGTAATVNGTEIEEDTITKYIQDFRTSSDLESDDDWGSWMSENSMDPETVRSQVIDFYVEEELVKQAAEENDVTVDETTIDEQIDSMKSNYDSDEAWQSALEEMGTTEDAYRESIQKSMLEQALKDKVAADSATADDSEVLEMLNTYYSMFDGSKKSSHILFSSDDESTAQEVLDQLNAGTLSWEDAVAQYSTDDASKDENGNVGWDSITSFVDEYQTALDDLSVGQMSGLVTSEYGIHIIKCTDEWSGDGTATSLDAYPEEFVTYIRDVVKSQNQSDAYDTWFSDYKEQADIQINDMPENVPYNLDMTQYESDDDSSDSSDTESTDDSSDTSTDESADESSEDTSAEESDSSDESSDE